MAASLWTWVKRIVMGLLILSPVLAGLTWLAGAGAKSRLAEQNPPPGRLVDAGGFNMHIHCTGEGSPTVILDAGVNDFYVSWAKVQPELARTTRVCSYDRAGLGWSGRSPVPRTNEVMAVELHTLLAQAGIEGPYILVGHSFGGINMRRFARMYPGETAGLVLVDSAQEGQMRRLPFAAGAAEDFFGQFRTLSAMSSFGLVALMPASVPNRGLPEEAYRQYQAVMAVTDYFEGAIAETTAFYSGERSSKLEGLGDLPLIVLSHGLPDRSLGLGEAEQMQFEQEWSKMQAELAALSSDSRQIIAEQSAHDIQLDQPGLVVEAVRQLLSRVRP